MQDIGIIKVVHDFGFELTNCLYNWKTFKIPRNLSLLAKKKTLLMDPQFHLCVQYGEKTLLLL